MARKRSTKRKPREPRITFEFKEVIVDERPGVVVREWEPRTWKRWAVTRTSPREMYTHEVLSERQIDEFQGRGFDVIEVLVTELPPKRRRKANPSETPNSCGERRRERTGR